MYLPMSRILFLFCYIIFLLTVVSANPLYAKRAQGGQDEGRTSFPQSTHHTEAFNVVHVIAAVVGIVGAAAVTIIAFIMCRRRRRQQQEKMNKQQSVASTLPGRGRPISSSSTASTPSSSFNTSSPTAPTSIQPSQQPMKSISTFDQFASAYCYDERQQDHSHQGVNSALSSTTATTHTTTTTHNNNNDTLFIPLPSPPPPPYRP